MRGIEVENKRGHKVLLKVFQAHVVKPPMCDIRENFAKVVKGHYKAKMAIFDEFSKTCAIIPANKYGKRVNKRTNER